MSVERPIFPRDIRSWDLENYFQLVQYYLETTSKGEPQGISQGESDLLFEIADRSENSAIRSFYANFAHPSLFGGQFVTRWKRGVAQKNICMNLNPDPEQRLLPCGKGTSGAEDLVTEVPHEMIFWSDDEGKRLGRLNSKMGDWEFLDTSKSSPVIPSIDPVKAKELLSRDIGVLPLGQFLIFRIMAHPASAFNREYLLREANALFNLIGASEKIDIGAKILYADFIDEALGKMPTPLGDKEGNPLLDENGEPIFVYARFMLNNDIHSESYHRAYREMRKKYTDQMKGVYQNVKEGMSGSGAGLTGATVWALLARRLPLLGPFLWGPAASVVHSTVVALGKSIFHPIPLILPGHPAALPPILPFYTQSSNTPPQSGPQPPIIPKGNK